MKHAPPPMQVACTPLRIDNQFWLRYCVYFTVQRFLYNMLYNIPVLQSLTEWQHLGQQTPPLTWWKTLKAFSPFWHPWQRLEIMLPLWICLPLWARVPSEYLSFGSCFYSLAEPLYTIEIKLLYALMLHCLYMVYCCVLLGNILICVICYSGSVT